MSTRPRPRALVALLAGLLTLAAVASGCDGGGDDGDGAAEPAATPTENVSGPVDTWPLTGLPVRGAGTSVRRVPPLVLKLDNTPSSAPQLGLGDADLVVEELVEGGMTRLAAFFYSRIPGVVGPVRSMRASDIGIVSPVDATMVTSGAAAVTIGRLKKAGVPFVTEGSPGFARDDARTAPYNLMADLGDVAAALKQKPGRPVDYLPWGAAGDLPRGKPARTVDAAFSGGHTTSWVYRGGHYANDNGFAAPDDQFAADTVLVLRVRVGDAGYRDPAGNPVPETQLEGDGDALLFHGGEVVRGTWHKDALDAPIELTAGGQDLSVPAGHTWIELVPRDGGDVTFSG